MVPTYKITGGGGGMFGCKTKRSLKSQERDLDFLRDVLREVPSAASWLERTSLLGLTAPAQIGTIGTQSKHSLFDTLDAAFNP